VIRQTRVKVATISFIRFDSCGLEIFEKELSDSLEKLDARGRVANGMASARKNQ
jgi:hypothetical protein